MPAKSKSEQMAVVEICYQSLLLPMAKALKVVELLSGAVIVQRDYDDRRTTYVVKEIAEVEFRTVRASDVRESRTHNGRFLLEGPRGAE